jgi:hypothetical protein
MRRYAPAVLVTSTVGVGVAMGAMGCDYTPSTPAPPSPSPSSNVTVIAVPTPRPPTPCIATLAQYCDGPCPTYREDFRAIVRECPTAPQGTNYYVGSCPGVYDYTLRSHPHDRTLAYFDTNGVMIGARSWSENKELCGGTLSNLEVGDIPPCPVAETADYIVCIHQ